MDNSSIYESIMMNGCFNRLKAIRDCWNDEKSSVYGVETIMDIGGEEFRNYDFIMNQCHLVIVEMIPFLVAELLKVYRISAKYYEINQNDAHVFSLKDGEKWPDYIEQSNRKKVFAFSCKESDKTGLYVFKEFGIGNHIPKSLLKTIMNENNVDRYCYVSMVEKDAYSEVINHNDDEKDPTRGTGIYSLKQFFDFFFGIEEYSLFKKFANKFTERVKDYFGFEIVRTLKPNTLHNFRKTVRDNLMSFDIKKIDDDSRLVDNQINVINYGFYKDKNYELLTGANDFAQSYMTAEWLFSSLEEAGNIDLTAIAMGYFKSIEQLLFDFIKLHVKENDSITRYIFVGKGKSYADAKGYAVVTRNLMEDENITKDINLGSLTGFFGYYNERSSQYIYRNKDLLKAEITDDTYEYIIDVLSGIVGLRNGYFHKHNLKEWESVIDARNCARKVFYFLLGAYAINEVDKKNLGIIQIDEHDDYYRLCEYMNGKGISEDGLRIPIYYINGQTDSFGFFMGYHDDYIEYDNYGEPIYSGVYFGRLGDKHHRIKATRETLPAEIWEGELIISRNVPLEIRPSGPLRKIFKDGKFFG